MSSTSSSARPPDGDLAETPTPSSLEHDVVPGDTLSDLAERYLGAPGRYPEIFDLNEGVAQADGRALTDPDLILPGWRLTIHLDDTPDLTEEQPSTSPEPALQPEPPAPVEPAVPDAGAHEAPDDLPVEMSDDRPEDTRAHGNESGAFSDAPPPTTSIISAPTHDVVAPADESSVADDTAPGSNGPADGSSGLPTVAGIAGALALATGILLRIRRRQAVRRARGARRQPELRPEAAQTASAVSAAADVPLVQWAAQHLALAFRALRHHDVHGAPLAVEISEDAGLEILWSAPQQGAPAPWKIADGGWAWRLAYDPDEPLPPDALPAAIPALVTIGQRDGRQLMVDLEAFGTLTVSGDRPAVDDFLRSVAVELASGQDLADAYVLTHSITSDPGHLERLRSCEPDEIISTIRSQRVDSDTNDDHGFGTFTERLRSPAPIDVTVVVSDLDNDARSRIELECPPRSAVAFVAAGQRSRDDVAHIEIVGPGHAVLQPLDLTFAPVALPTETTTSLADLATALDEELTPEPTDLTEPHSNDPEPSGSTSENGSDPHSFAPGAEPSDNGHETADLDLFPIEDHPNDQPALLVRVLGPPSIPDRPDLGRRDLNLVVFLACRSGPVAASALQDALWGGKPVEPKTVWNVVGSARRALGELPNGVPVIPPTDRSHGTLRVDDGVTTDLATLRDLVDRSADEPTSVAVGLLREALSLVNGPPFDAPGYDWAHRDQDVAEASALIEHASLRLVELALEAGDTDLAREALVRGLRGLPGNEELYRSRMRVEHDAGNTAGVKQSYDELVTYLADFESEPSESTTALLRRLTTAAHR